MKIITTSLIIFLSFLSFSQNDDSKSMQTIKMDTIKTYNKVIICKIKEIGDDNVKFHYPNEDILITINKNIIDKISFSSGRVESFSEVSKLKIINGWKDFKKVSITNEYEEVKGLFKLDVISSDAQAGTIFSNVTKIKNKAFEKLKIKAAMTGANIVHISNDRTEGHRFTFGPTNLAETILTGVTYTNKLPDINLFKELVKRKSEFALTQIISYPFNNQYPVVRKIRRATMDISDYNIDKNFININHKKDVFTVVYLSYEKIILMKYERRRLYNYILE